MRTDPVPPTGFPYLALAASGLVKTGPGVCVLLLVSSSSSLVIRLWDNTSAATTKIVDSMAVYAGEEYDVPGAFTTGLYVEFVSGTGGVTVFYV